jgi:hypothetical protein
MKEVAVGAVIGGCSGGAIVGSPEEQNGGRGLRPWSDGRFEVVEDLNPDFWMEER